jgi:glutathione S-transferase
MSAPELELFYFDSPGRAEPIRIVLHMAGRKFADKRLKGPDYAALRSSGDLPFGSLPVLRVDGVAIVETPAILRYVARLGALDLIPSDPFGALLSDSAIEAFNDELSHALGPSMFERDMTKKLAMRAEFVAGPMKRVFTYVEGLLALRPGPFLAGEAMSLGDMVVANQVLRVRSGALDGIGVETLAPYPRIGALADAYVAEPRIKAYQDARATG